MSRASRWLFEDEQLALNDLIAELGERLREQTDMLPKVRKILTTALKEACRVAGRPLPDLNTEDHVRVQSRQNEIVFARAARTALVEFLLDVEHGNYAHDHMVGEHEGEPCVFSRVGDVYAQYLPFREFGIARLRFKSFLVDSGVVLDREVERTIYGRRIGHLNVFNVARINELAGVVRPAPPAPQHPAIDPADIDEVEALATVLKTYFQSQYKGQHFLVKVKLRQCLLATAEHIHAFCQGHHATMKIAGHRLGPRGLKAAARRHGLLVDDNYGLKREGKIHKHLLAFDVKLVEEFYGRYAPGPD